MEKGNGYWDDQREYVGIKNLKYFKWMSYIRISLEKSGN